MADSLASYIYQRLQQGVHESEIRTELIAQGYTPQIIDASMPIPVTSFWNSTVLLVLVFIVVLAVGGIVYYLVTLTPELRLFVNLPNTSLATGGTLSIITSVYGTSSQEVDVVHQLFDKNNVSLIRVVEKVLPGKTDQSQLSLPMSPGEYALVSSTNQDRIVQIIQLTSIQLLPHFCYDAIQDQGETGIDCGGPCNACKPLLTNCSSCEDGDSCTKDSCSNGACIHEKQTPCCGDFICSPEESILGCPQDCALRTIQPSVKQTAQTAVRQSQNSFARGVQVCAQLPVQDDADECLAFLSVETKSQNTCAEIARVEKRDACYLDYAQQTNDYTICDKVSNRLFKASCYSFRNSQT